MEESAGVLAARVLRLLMKSESEAARRHFDVVVEKMVSERNLALDRSVLTTR
jgi:hypothetical protein